jgi:hypothetical protein
MSNDEGEDWERGDLLAEANELNAKIKQYIGSHQNNQTTPSREMLENYKTDIMGYLVDIDSEDFGPRTDRLTKDGIEQDLRNHLRMIDSILSRGTGKSKRRKHSRRRKSKRRSGRSSSRRRKTRRRKAIKRWSH